MPIYKRERTAKYAEYAETERPTDLSSGSCFLSAYFAVKEFGLGEDLGKLPAIEFLRFAICDLRFAILRLTMKGALSLATPVTEVR